MTIDPTTFLHTLTAHLEADAFGDPEGGPHAQQANMLRLGLPEFIAAISAPMAPLGRDDLQDLGTIEQCVRRLGQRAQERARQ